MAAEEAKLEEARGRLPVTAKLGEILRVKNMRSPGSIFRAWDADGSEQISPIEFRDQMRALGLEATDIEIDEMFREFDSDDSGFLDAPEIKVRSWRCVTVCNCM